MTRQVNYCLTLKISVCHLCVCCLPFLAVGRFGPGVLQADIDGGVDDAGLRNLGAREEHEFGFVKDASVSLNIRLVGHRVGSIDQI